MKELTVAIGKSI